MRSFSIPKGQRPKNNLFDVYQEANVERNWHDRGYIQIVSIDPCKSKISNFALRIERRYDYIDFVETIELATIIGPKIKSEENYHEEYVNSGELYDNLRQIKFFLQNYHEEFFDTHIFLIERQLPQNYKAVRIAQCVFDFFSEYTKKSPLYPLLIEINPKVKGKMLGGPGGPVGKLTEFQLKKWAEEKAFDILSSRDDQTALHLFQERKKYKKTKLKNSDISDTICQIEGFVNCISF